ncbi:MAG TPA: hypothetical protein VFN61_01655 [Acidimicrobiales bacterium]|nr:hypothetical protein [Acidimicrobiales bacterium]
MIGLSFHRGEPNSNRSTGRLALLGAAAGVVAGMFMAMFMMIWTAVSGAGFWAPLNVGVASLAFRIVPPASLMPMMAKMMPAHPVMPLAKAAMAVQSGHATNAQIATFMKAMPLGARNMVMSAMPVQAGHLLVGALLHLAFSAVLGAALGLAVAALARLDVPATAGRAMVVAGALIGSAALFIIQESVVMPSLDPIMTVLPHGVFFLAHIVFGLVLGAGGVVAAGALNAAAPRSANGGEAVVGTAPVVGTPSSLKTATTGR